MNEFFNGVTAFGTAGSFIAAVCIYGFSTRATRQDRRQSQAVLVDAWVKSVQKYDNGHQVNFEISNHSDQAVRLLNIRIYDGEMGFITTVQVVPPTQRGEFLKVASELIPNTAEKQAMNADKLQGLYSMTITFVDSAGRRWGRSQGKLTESRKDGTLMTWRKQLNLVFRNKFRKKGPSAGEQWRGSNEIT